MPITVDLPHLSMWVWHCNFYEYIFSWQNCTIIWKWAQKLEVQYESELHLFCFVSFLLFHLPFGWWNWPLLRCIVATLEWKMVGRGMFLFPPSSSLPPPKVVNLLLRGHSPILFKRLQFSPGFKDDNGWADRNEVEEGSTWGRIKGKNCSAPRERHFESDSYFWLMRVNHSHKKNKETDAETVQPLHLLLFLLPTF